MAGVTDGVLPEGWVEAKLGDVVDYGKTQKVTLSDVEPDTWVLELEDIQKDCSVIIKRLNAAERPFKSTKNRFNIGDVLYGKLRPYLNKVVVADNSGVCSTEIIPINAEPYISNRFLFHWLKSDQFLSYVNDVSYGVNMPRLGTKDGVAAPLVVPPLAEQKVITEKLDSLLAQVESTKARLERLPEILKRFRQSVLAAAVSGKLTEEWRVENEPSSPLEIISDSTAFITTKKAKEFAEKPFLDDELTCLIPDSWHWVRLSKITEIVSGVAKGSKNKGETVTRPYLRVANVQRGFLDLTEIKDIEVPESKAEALELKYGDILFNEGGDLDKLGRGWIWENQIPKCIHQNHVFRARRLSEGLEPKFVSYYGNSEGKEYFIRNGTQSVNLASINKTTLSLLPVPLPPAEEQTEIVRRVEELFAYADKIQQQADAALQRVNSLTQSILAKAFRGELTADWRAANPELISGENSAEALLEKIKAERTAQKPKKKTRAKKT